MTPADLAYDLLGVALRLGFLALLYYFVYRVVALLVESSRTPQAQPKPLAVLVVIDPGNSSLQLGQELPIEPVTSLGRGSHNSVVIDDPSVSSEHALLLWDKDAWWISDRDSKTGTWLNGLPVTRPSKVKFGDTIGVGSVKLKLAPASHRGS